MHEPPNTKVYRCPDCDAKMNPVKRNGKLVEPLRYICRCGHMEFVKF